MTAKPFSSPIAAGTPMLAGACLFAIAVAGPSAAQGYSPPDIELQKEKLRAFAKLEGDWSGDAWTISPNGQRVTFVQSESVRYALGGLVMIVQGAGRGKDAAPDAEPYFEALATIAWDEKIGDYRIRSYANGHYGEYDIEPTENGFVWSAPGVTYTAIVEGDTWTEYGERQLPTGETVRFIGFTVSRQDP